jgi:hypothetical protein
MQVIAKGRKSLTGPWTNGHLNFLHGLTADNSDSAAAFNAFLN